MCARAFVGLFVRHFCVCTCWLGGLWLLFAAVVDCGFAVVFLDSVGYGLGLGKNNITYNHCFKRSIKL